jgi:nitrogen fixation protein FixH
MNGHVASLRQGRWIPWVFVAGFLVVAAVNGAMIVLAVASWTGLSDETPYENGLRFNDTLDAAAAQARLGWRVTPRLEGRVLSVSVVGSDGRPLSGARVGATIRRPLDERYDATAELVPVAAGIYRSDLDLPLPGAWEVTIRIDRDGDSYRLVRRLVVP